MVIQTIYYLFPFISAGFFSIKALCEMICPLEIEDLHAWIVILFVQIMLVKNHNQLSYL